MDRGQHRGQEMLTPFGPIQDGEGRGYAPGKLRREGVSASLLIQLLLLL